MTTDYYLIEDGHGNAITDGVAEHEVARMARRLADERGETVYYARHPALDGETGEHEEVETTAVHPQATITDEQIEALRTEAGAAGDLDQVAICDRALLEGDAEARAECARVIADAEAQR